MKTLTVWKDGNNLGSQFKEDDKVILFNELSKQEIEDFVSTLRQFADFYQKFI